MLIHRQSHRRVVRDDGLLILTVPNLAAPAPLLERLPVRSVHAREGPEHHFRDGYSPGELTDLLEDSGFRSEAMVSVGGTACRLAADVVSLAHLADRSVAERCGRRTCDEVEVGTGGTHCCESTGRFSQCCSLSRGSARCRGGSTARPCS